MKKIGGDIRSFFSKVSVSPKQPANNSPAPSSSSRGDGNSSAGPDDPDVQSISSASRNNPEG